MSAKAVGNLASYLDALQSWARDAYTACGPKEGLEKGATP